MLKYLDHVNIRTHRLELLTSFYCEVLGLVAGPRPNFSFEGAWLYCGERPVVHLVKVPLGGDLAPPSPSLALQHFAFSAAGLAPFLERLRKHQVEYRIGKIPDAQLCQVNVHDPDGNHVHIDFPLAEAESLGH